MKIILENVELSLCETSFIFLYDLKEDKFLELRQKADSGEKGVGRV